MITTFMFYKLHLSAVSALLLVYKVAVCWFPWAEGRQDKCEGSSVDGERKKGKCYDALIYIYSGTSVSGIYFKQSHCF